MPAKTSHEVASAPGRPAASEELGSASHPMSRSSATSWVSGAPRKDAIGSTAGSAGISARRPRQSCLVRMQSVKAARVALSYEAMQR